MLQLLLARLVRAGDIRLCRTRRAFDGFSLGVWGIVLGYSLYGVIVRTFYPAGNGASDRDAALLTV